MLKSLSRFEGQIDLLRGWVRYDPKSGILVRKKHAGTRWRAGEILGTINTDGYILVGVLGHRVYAHHIAWMLYHNEIPSGMVDHINGVKADNRIENLRLVTPSQSVCNTSLRSDNSSGVKGVHWDRGRQKWMAFISIGRKRKHLGRFDEMAAAVTCRLSAEKKLHGEFARQPLSSN